MWTKKSWERFYFKETQGLQYEGDAKVIGIGLQMAKVLPITHYSRDERLEQLLQSSVHSSKFSEWIFVWSQNIILKKVLYLVDLFALFCYLSEHMNFVAALSSPWLLWKLSEINSKLYPTNFGAHQ